MTTSYRICVAGVVAAGVVFTAGSVHATAPEPPDPELAAEQAFTTEAEPTFGTLSTPACWIDPSGAPITCFGFTDDLSIVVGLAQPSESFTFTEYSLIDEQPDVATPTTTLAVSADDASFVLQYTTAVGGLLDEAGGYSGAASEAITEFDVAEGALQAQLAADTYEELYDIALATPGADTTPVGQAVVAAMETCSGAWQAAADALDAFDMDAINAATVLLGDCSADLTSATDLLT